MAELTQTLELDKSKLQDGDELTATALSTGLAESAASNTVSYTSNNQKLAFMLVEDAENGDYYVVTGRGQCVLTDIVIPSTHDGKPVKEIAENAFTEDNTITSITIPGAVRTIGAKAFKSCAGITTVSIGSGVTEIGASAFEQCLKLSSLTLANTIKTIGAAAFKETFITSVTVPSSVNAIGKAAFMGCPLEEIRIPFVGNSRLLSDNRHFGYIFGAETYTDNTACVPKTLKDVYITGNSQLFSYAFYKCTHIENVSIMGGSQCISIPDYGFYGCKKFTGLQIPNTVERIGVSAFHDCTGMTAVGMYDGKLKSIGDNAFRYCASLKNITIPDSVETIGEAVFRMCTSLQSITLGTGITSITKEMFYGCEALTEMYIPTLNITKVDESAFCNCTNLNRVSLPDTVTEIGAYAFKNCSSFKAINYETAILGSVYNIKFEGVKTIGVAAFENCTNLENVYIPDSTTTIGYHAFTGCTKLDTVSIGKGVNNISAAFDRVGAQLTYVIFANPYGWFSNVSGAISSDVLSEKIIAAEYIKLYGYHKLTRLEQMVAPTITLSGDTLAITDSTGIATQFKVFVNNGLYATINAKDGSVTLA